MNPTFRPNRRLVTAAAIGALLLASAACGSGSPSATASPSPRPTPTATSTPTAAPTAAPSAPRVVLHWWNTNPTDPGKSIWETAVRMFTVDHPDVEIQIEAMDANTLAARVTAGQASGAMPDLLDSTGDPQFVTLAKLGLLQDIRPAVERWTLPSKGQIYGLNVFAYEGRQYGAPWAIGQSGFFYNKKIFAGAGITEDPRTWSDLLSDVATVKATGTIPFAIAGRDRWPAMHLWSYLVLREGGPGTLAAFLQGAAWAQPACARASADLATLVSRGPFQPGYMSATYEQGQAALVAGGRAAIELSGEWGPTAERAASKDGKGLGDDLGWFPFPAVSTGPGSITDGLGSANGIVVGKNAPPQAVEFLHFLLTKGIQDEIGGSQLGLPSVGIAADSLPDPALGDIVASRLHGGNVELYPNLTYSAGATKAIEDAVALLLAGRGTPDATCAAVAAAARSS